MPPTDNATIGEFLRHLALFAGLSDDERARLIEMGSEVGVAPGEVLIREGEPGDAMYVVLDGAFEILKDIEGRAVPIAERGTGDVIGEIALLDNEPRTATVQATRASRLLCIDRAAFDKLLAWSPTAIRSIIKTVVERLRNTESMLRQSEKMASLGTLSAGIAHELNNPASAARRAASQLATEIASVEQLETALNTLSLDAAQRAAFEAWRVKLAQSTGNLPPIDPLERADREGEAQTWLESQGVADAWEIAPRLVDLGLGVEQLQELARTFGEEQVRPVLAWLAARANLESLLAEIGTSAERISTIVGAIKSYVYLDQAPVQEVDVHKGIEDTLVILHFKLKHGVAVRREYARDLPHITAYASELNQVWTNIIDNAIDAMDGKGEIRIKTWPEGKQESGTGAERVVVEICDNGPEIPQEVLPRIFDPFFTTKPIGKGTGLGLHICYNIVTLRHHGQISVSSRPGETCFRVALPVK